MPTISIFGATGTQGKLHISLRCNVQRTHSCATGSAVLRAVLADGTFTPRAVTRNPDSDSSKALAAKGVEVVKGDLFDLESIKEAIRGSDAVFGVRSCNSLFMGLLMTGQQGKNLVDSAKAVGVKFFPYAGLPSSKALSNGKYPTIYHIDHKAEIFEYLKGSGVPCAAVDTAYFADNLWNWALQKIDTGYIIPVPRYSPTSTQTFTWAANDLGPSVLALLKNYTDSTKNILGKAFPVVTFIETYPEVAKKISAAIGKEVIFTAGLEELDEMVGLHSDIGMYKDTPVPNLDLVMLGVKFGTLDEMIAREIVPRL
ncbi:hypothetical protein FB451DRAFT_1025161 [Mycena latifolia]|nr:hypothetical protein FB451DRAFT_1025161 [Mycena latifolia]